MKNGDLVIWEDWKEKSWGHLQNIFHDPNVKNTKFLAVQVRHGHSGHISTLWLDRLRNGKVVEVKSGIKITQEELDAILAAYSDSDKFKLINEFAYRYQITNERVMGFGLMEDGEIIYNQVVEDESEQSNQRF